MCKQDRRQTSLQNRYVSKSISIRIENSSIQLSLPTAFGVYRNQRQHCMRVILFPILLPEMQRMKEREKTKQKSGKQLTKENSSKCYWTIRNVLKPTTAPTINIHVRIHSGSDMLTYWTMQWMKEGTRVQTMWHAVHSVRLYLYFVYIFWKKQTFFVGKVHHIPDPMPKQM